MRSAGSWCVGKLEGRTALVTGASRGIGKAVAVALAKAGCNIVVNYRIEAEQADEVAATIRALGRGCIVEKADVEMAVGVVDILVNNAGIAQTKPLQEIDLNDWEHVIRVNLTSAFLLSQRVLINMRARQWGRIINIGSVAAQNGGVIGPHYAASKAG